MFVKYKNGNVTNKLKAEYLKVKKPLIPYMNSALIYSYVLILSLSRMNFVCEISIFQVLFNFACFKQWITEAYFFFMVYLHIVQI